MMSAPPELIGIINTLLLLLVGIVGFFVKATIARMEVQIARSLTNQQHLEIRVARIETMLAINPEMRGLTPRDLIFSHEGTK